MPRARQARENLASLDAAQLREFQEILDMENPDLFKLFTGQQAVPADASNALLRRLCDDMQLVRSAKATVTSTAPFEGKVWE